MLSQLKPLMGPGAHEREICTVKEIGEYLGVSESKIRQLVRRSAIPYAKIDGQYRFFLPAIREWMRSIMTPAAAQENEREAHAIAHDIWNSRTGK